MDTTFPVTASDETRRPPRGGSRRGHWSRRADAATLALLYGLAVMVAADVTLREQVSLNLAESPFVSEAVFLTVLRVAAFGFGVLFSLLQAAILGFLFALVTRAKRPKLLVSWTWVLLSQIPLMAAVAVGFLMGGPNSLGFVQEPWLRLTLGVVSVLIYTLMAWYPVRPATSRVAAFVVLAIGINSALILIGMGGPA